MIHSCSEIAPSTAEMLPSLNYKVWRWSIALLTELVESWADQLISRKTERNLFKLSFD